MQEAEYQFLTEELGNCPNCGAVVVREQRNCGLTVTYFWPCVECGFTWHGAQIPDLD